ncbi:type II toxin-antitoxin system RelE/ParE family toxin [Streptomyces sp. NPDC050145]|uniref:type II toxin-antitoxin system RelE/ParE family toxin n=1 Tax=Streptomyces sp. NPDC050145 TaxID=3365602 RepID=UPI0037891309
MPWEVIVLEPALSWLHGLRKEERATLVLISAAITALQREGPGLGRPLVDTVRGSRLTHLKELRPGSAGSSEVRMLFAFDPVCRAVFLVGGDKSGNWHNWYDTHIPIAEQVYEAHLRQIEEDER